MNLLKTLITKKNILSAAPLVLVLGILYFLSTRLDPVVVRDWAQKAGAFGPLVIMLCGILTAVLAPISGTPLMLVGFALYGADIVFVLAISGLISSVVNFYISKKWGRPFVTRLVGQNNITKVDELTKNHGVVSLALLRIFLGGINDFVSYAMGLTNMRFKTYFTVTVFSAIPGTIFWYFIARNSGSTLAFLMWTIVFTLALGLVFAVLRTSAGYSKKIKLG